MKITKKAFRKWLESFPPRKVVGIGNMTCDCPLANFSGQEQLSTNYPETAWQHKFMDEVDYGTPNWYYRITASRALKILDSI